MYEYFPTFLKIYTRLLWQLKCGIKDCGYSHLLHWITILLPLNRLDVRLKKKKITWNWTYFFLFSVKQIECKGAPRIRFCDIWSVDVYRLLEYSWLSAVNVFLVYTTWCVSLFSYRHQSWCIMWGMVFLNLYSGSQANAEPKLV